MADPFKDIAKELGRATLIAPRPSAEAEVIGQIGAGLTQPIQEGVEKFRARERKDIAEGEYAASPYRMDLSKQVGGFFGRKDWVDLANQWEKTRNELLAWTPGELKKIPKMRTVEVDFNRDYLTGMKPGETIKIGDTTIMRNRAEGAGWAFRTDDMPPGKWAASRVGGAEEIIQLFGQKVKSEEAIPGEFEEKRVGAKGRTKAQIQKELKDLRIKINRTIPSKSELERMISRADILAARRPRVTGRGRERWDEQAKIKFQEMQRDLRDMQSPDSDTYKRLESQAGDIPYSDIKGYFYSYIRNNNFGMTEGAVKRGAVSDMMNATLNSLKTTDEAMVDQALNGFRQSINRDIQKINALPDETDKVLHSYALLMKIAPMADNAATAVEGAVGDALLMKTLQDAVINPERDYNTGVLAIPKLREDFANMTEVALKKRVPGYAKKGGRIYDETVKTIQRDVSGAVLPKKFLGLIGKKTTSKNIHEIVKNNLLEDPRIARLAPTNEAEIANPNDTQRKWMDLFEATTGREITMTDLKKAQKTVTRFEQAKTPELPETGL